MTIVVLAMLLAGGVDAQVIYRCKAADGVVAVQSAPCAMGQEDLGARYYDTGSASPEAIDRRRQADAEMARRRQQRDARVHSVSHPSRAGDTRSQQRRQCQVARENRDRVLDKVGLKRTYDMLRNLNESVQRACKGL